MRFSCVQRFSRTSINVTTGIDAAVVIRAVLGVTLALSACSRTPAGTQRIVFLPFENLTDDRSLDWIASAAPTIAAEDLAGVQGLVSLRAPNVSDGYLAQATRFVHGYFTGAASNLRFEIEVEDAARHKIATSASENGNVLAAMNAAAKWIAPAAHAFPASSPEAVEAWGRGEYERAVTLDPDFGAAWLAWAEKLQQAGDSARAVEVASQALARSSLRSELDRAHIALFSADARHDVDAREKALTELARLTPSDAAVLTALAEAAMNARHFREAAAHYRELAKLEPANANIPNLLGYAEAFAGDLDAARKALEEYGREPGQHANSLDSLGEVHFMRGKFAEAEQYFTEAHQSNPALLAGEDLLKAAYAHWLAGDTVIRAAARGAVNNRGADKRAATSGGAASGIPSGGYVTGGDVTGGDLQGADALMARFLQFRRNQKDATVDWREASWLYATGRREQAVAKMAAVPNRQLAQRQIALWNGQIELPHDLAALKQRFDNTPPSADSQVRVLYAAALVAAGQKDEARPLLELWPMPWAPGDALLESWVLPKFMELRAAVGLK
jgi:tetratricopeptide (TPR) repeat protein